MMMPEKECRIKLKPLYCLFLSMFTVWEMGLIFFSSTTLSLYGRSSIILDSNIYLIVIIAGYISSIIINVLFIKQSLILTKVLTILAIIISLLILTPINENITSILLFISVFLCVFMIGSNYNIETYVLTNDTELKYCFIGIICSSLIIGFIQSELINISYIAFQIVSILLLVLFLIALFKLPKTIDIKFITYKENKVQKTIPIKIKIGLFFAMIIACISLLFGLTFAESYKYGVGLYYLLATIFGIISFILLRKSIVSPFKLLTITFVVASIGFVFAILSFTYEIMAYPAIAFLSISSISACLCGFFTNTFSNYSPLKTFGQSVTLIGLITALFHAIILSLFRDNLTVLFTILALVSIFTTSIYTTLESSLSLLWKKLLKKSEEIKDPIPINDNNPFINLFQRENEVADLILLGYSTTEMCDKMNLSENTIRTYKKNLYVKLDIHSKRELFDLQESNKKQSH